MTKPEEKPPTPPAPEFVGCIVKDDAKYVSKNARADAYYKSIEDFLKTLGVTKVLTDAGADFTLPPHANFWIGHGKGCQRAQFMSEDDQGRFAKLGCPEGVLTDEDREWQSRVKNSPVGVSNGSAPDSHYELSPEQREHIKDIIQRAKLHHPPTKPDQK